MKTSQTFIRALGVVIAAATLMACEAKVDGGDFTPTIPDFSQSVKVEGLWRTDCVLVPGTNIYTIQSFQFTGSNVKALADVYTSSSCATKYPGAATTEMNGTFTLLGSSTVVVDAVNVDYNLTDKATNATEKIYDVLLIENNIMYMGATKGTSANQRPTKIDRTLPFKKR